MGRLLRLRQGPRAAACTHPPLTGPRRKHARANTLSHASPLLPLTSAVRPPTHTHGPHTAGAVLGHPELRQDSDGPAAGAARVGLGAPAGPPAAAGRRLQGRAGACCTGMQRSPLRMQRSPLTNPCFTGTGERHWRLQGRAGAAADLGRSPHQSSASSATAWPPAPRPSGLPTHSPPSHSTSNEAPPRLSSSTLAAKRSTALFRAGQPKPCTLNPEQGLQGPPKP